MNKCSKCNSIMIRASSYDPEGLIPLYGGKKENGEWWVCINPSCGDGRKNRRLSE